MLVGGAKLQRVPGLMPADNLMEPGPRISDCRALGVPELVLSGLPVPNTWGLVLFCFVF